jgi:hypothetical protein
VLKGEVPRLGELAKRSGARKQVGGGRICARGGKAPNEGWIENAGSARDRVAGRLHREPLDFDIGVVRQHQLHVVSQGKFELAVHDKILMPDGVLQFHAWNRCIEVTPEVRAAGKAGHIQQLGVQGRTRRQRGANNKNTHPDENL